MPFGVLMLGTGLLTLIFGMRECSDFWSDCMKAWWTSVRPRCRGIRRLVIYLDNGPKNSGVTRKFLRRMVEFADQLLQRDGALLRGLQAYRVALIAAKPNLRDVIRNIGRGHELPE